MGYRACTGWAPKSNGRSDIRQGSAGRFVGRGIKRDRRDKKINDKSIMGRGSNVNANASTMKVWAAGRCKLRFLLKIFKVRQAV